MNVPAAGRYDGLFRGTQYQQVSSERPPHKKFIKFSPEYL